MLVLLLLLLFKLFNLVDNNVFKCNSKASFFLFSLTALFSMSIRIDSRLVGKVVEPSITILAFLLERNLIWWLHGSVLDDDGEEVGEEWQEEDVWHGHVHVHDGLDVVNMIFFSLLFILNNSLGQFL